MQRCHDDADDLTIELPDPPPIYRLLGDDGSTHVAVRQEVVNSFPPPQDTVEEISSCRAATNRTAQNSDHTNFILLDQVGYRNRQAHCSIDRFIDWIEGALPSDLGHEVPIGDRDEGALPCSTLEHSCFHQPIDPSLYRLRPAIPEASGQLANRRRITVTSQTRFDRRQHCEVRLLELSASVIRHHAWTIARSLGV
jgi:hypothetical protein